MGLIIWNNFPSSIKSSSTGSTGIRSIEKGIMDWKLRGLQVGVGEERRERTRKARRKQIESYNAWQVDLAKKRNAAREILANRETEREALGKSCNNVSAGAKKKVNFHARERLRDAVTRSDMVEGKHLYLIIILHAASCTSLLEVLQLKQVSCLRLQASFAWLLFFCLFLIVFILFLFVPFFFCFGFLLFSLFLGLF